MYSDDDTAGVNGDVFFGGLLDRCITNEVYKESGIDVINYLIRIQPHTNTSISSQPYELTNIKSVLMIKYLKLKCIGARYLRWFSWLEHKLVPQLQQ